MTDTIGPVLVCGATGTTGGELLRQLSDSGADLRGTVRKSADAERLPTGVQAVVADFDDTDSLAAALQGVRRTYLVTPSSERAEQQQLDFLDRAAAAGVEQVVVLSQLGTRADSPVRFLRYHAAAEHRVQELGLGHTILRPNLYFQGTFAFAGPIAATNGFSAPIGHAAVSAIDTRDIAAAAAAALLDERHLGRTYTLTGPGAITHTRIAAALSAATGREITFTDCTPEEFATALEGVLPPWQVEGLLEDYAHYLRGEAAEVTDAIEQITGRAPRTIDDFARDHRDVFIKSS